MEAKDTKTPEKNEAAQKAETKLETNADLKASETKVETKSIAGFSTRFFLKLVAKRIAKEGIERLAGSQEEAKARVIQWIRDEIGGWNEKLKEDAAIGALNVVWAIVFDEIVKNLERHGASVLSYSEQEHLGFTDAVARNTMVRLQLKD